MDKTIDAGDFKKLMSGATVFSEYQQAYSKKHYRYPVIRLVESENKITVKGDFEVLGDLVFQSGETYDKEIFFDGGTYKNIIFRGGSFRKVFFRRGTFNGFVSIRGGNIKNLVLLGGTFNHWLGTLNGINNSDDGINKLADEPLVIERFEIEGGTYVNNIWISGGKIDSLEIKCVSPVKIHCNPNDDRIFDTTKNEYTPRHKSSPDIRNLIISRYSNKDNFIHISELELDTIRFEKFTNIGTITISNVVLNKYLSFENSDLGKTTFISCDFYNQTLYFNSSKITEVSLIGTDFPDHTRIKNLDSYQSTSHEIQKRVALSQLKKIYQNMGDAVTAAHYQAEELDTYTSTLPWGWEKCALVLNHQTNRHGQSWERALGVLVIGNIILYTIYCIFLGFKIDLSAAGLQQLVKNMAYSFEFLNPLRKSDFLPKALAGKSEQDIPPMAYVIDSIGKIFTAYLIYQLVAAFRKHGKKNDG